MLARAQPWIWLLPLTLPLLALVIDHQYQELRELMAAHLAISAGKLKLVRIAREPDLSKTKAVDARQPRVAKPDPATVSA